MTRNFRAINSEYNGLYNGNLALEQGKRTLAFDYKDDFWEILPVERVSLLEFTPLTGDSENADFARAEDKAVGVVQKHSIDIQGQEHNPKIDEAYMMLGKARYYDSRFIPAMEAFNYVLSRFPTSNSINSAKIWKEKTNIRLHNEEVAVKNLKLILKNTELSNEEYADASAIIAQAYINLEAADSAIIHITNAANRVENYEEKGRYLFIKGQLFNRIGQKDSANKAFADVIALNRRSPRNYMIHAEVEITKNFDYENGNREALLEHFYELAENRENRPYLDIIFHQMGNFHRTIDSIDKAKIYYNKSIKEFRQNQKVQAFNYLNMGDIHFDLAEYKNSGAYYDSTMMRLEQNSLLYRRVKKKRDNLDDVIKYEDIAQTNDSILRFVAMTPDQRQTYFINYTEKLKEAAIADSIAEAKEKDRFRDDEFFSGDGKGDNKDNGGSFYFYNQSTVSFGAQEFRRRWGNRTLDDDWRRSDKKLVNSEDDDLIAAEEQGQGTSILDHPKFDPETYLSLIPTEAEAIDSVTKERDMAYYQLGIIYKEKFREFELAINRLETLLTYHPEERIVLPAKYYLYKLYEIIEDPANMQKYANDIVSNYSDSRYAEIIRNPEAAITLDESSPEYKYAELYRKFNEGSYRYVVDKADEYIFQFVGEDILPKFELLKATALGKLEGLQAYKEAMNYVALTYPNTDEGKRAQSIFQETIPKLQNFNFDENDNVDKWKLIFTFESEKAADADALKEKIDALLAEKDYTFLSSSIDFYSENQIFLVIHGFGSKATARGLAELLKEEKKYKITQKSYPISSPNYTVVQIHKNFNAYNERNLN